MSVLVTHDPKNTIFSEFGSTMEEAKNNIISRADQLKRDGHYVRIESQGAHLRDGLYGWNLIAKKIQYS